MCRLNLPDDVLFVSDRLIRILLKIFEDYIDERQRVILRLCQARHNFTERNAS